MKIVKKKELIGAAKYGSCVECDKERAEYKISFGDGEFGLATRSVDLCEECLRKLGCEIYNTLDPYETR